MGWQWHAPIAEHYVDPAQVDANFVICESKKIVEIQVTGDSRQDRVLERKAGNVIPLLPDSYKESKTLILGSLVPSDYSSIFDGLVL